MNERKFFLLINRNKYGGGTLSVSVEVLLWHRVSVLRCRSVCSGINFCSGIKSSASMSTPGGRRGVATDVVLKNVAQFGTPAP